MTKAEAIEVLKNTAWLGTDIHMSKVDNALRVIEQVIEQENERMSDEEMEKFRQELIDASKGVNDELRREKRIKETDKSVVSRCRS